MNTNRLSVVLSFMFGHWFYVSPLRFRGVFYIFAWFYTITVNLSCTLMTFVCIFNFFMANRDFKRIIFLATGMFGMIQTITRAIFSLFYKKQIENILELFQNLLNNSEYKYRKVKLLFKVSRYSKGIAAFLILIYLTCFLYGFIIFGVVYENGRGNTTIDIFDENITDVREEWAKVDGIIGNIPSNLFTLYLSFIYLTTNWGYGKIIASDVLFFSWYMQIVEHYKILCYNLSSILLNCNKLDTEKMKRWKRLQHELNRLLTRVNTVTSPCIVVSMVINTLQVCFVIYLVAKGVLDVILAGSYIIMAGMALFQMFTYCHHSQKIKNQISKLQGIAYSAPWHNTQHNTQHAALMICSAATERAMPLPGAPFFALSLEFFASILGAIFTYFIVLLQIN
ncbi:Odorant receptor 20 [Ephemera danica]|nr:Odorant receptor 20 [Ephemera danica]